MGLDLGFKLTLKYRCLGIDVHYSLLATDAPDLWQNKIKYILVLDITAMELTFTQVPVPVTIKVDLNQNFNSTVQYLYSVTLYVLSL